MKGLLIRKHYPLIRNANKVFNIFPGKNSYSTRSYMFITDDTDLCPGITTGSNYFHYIEPLPTYKTDWYCTPNIKRRSYNKVTADITQYMSIPPRALSTFKRARI